MAFNKNFQLISLDLCWNIASDLKVNHEEGLNQNMKIKTCSVSSKHEVALDTDCDLHLDIFEFQTWLSFFEAASWASLIVEDGHCL